MGHCSTLGHILVAWMGQGLIALPANTKWDGREGVPERGTEGGLGAPSGWGTGSVWYEK